MNIQEKFENYIIEKKDMVKFSSLEISKGDVFIALQGSKYHGNKFINASLRKGAKYCITDKDHRFKNSNIIKVDNVIDYLSEIALKKRKKYKGKVIGITGSAGKTTLKETLAFFLKKENIISYSKKSYNNKLGVIISLLNLNLRSKIAIFEIGTNNFGEIRYLTNFIKPTEIFITNIQSTHLENFKSKKNIAIEKSDIFLLNDNKRKNLYINVTNNYEKLILNKAIDTKKLKIIRIDNSSKKYSISSIINKNNNYEVTYKINNKKIIFKFKSIIKFRLVNLLYCFAFFNENKIDTKIITKRYNYLKPVDGRGLIHNLFINNKKFKVIDESYNANPDTMDQTIDYFNNLKKPSKNKILILGNMNELGKNSDVFHQNLINRLKKNKFKIIILCGEFYRTSIKNLNKLKNKFIYLNNSNEIMNFVMSIIKHDDIIMIKCSNSTEVNKFTKILLKKG